jgi:hypothetical protein
VGDSLGATDRVTSGATSGRLDVWGYGWSAFIERPVFGWGLGRFRAAIQEHLSPAFVREHAPNDQRPIIFDAHNLVVELTVTIGVVGLALAAVFAWYAGRRAGGALALFVATIAFTWLLQPAALSTLPVVMIALGAAARPQPAPDHEPAAATDPTGAWWPRLSAAGLLIGVAAAAWLAVGDLRLQAGVDAMSARRIEAAARWLPTDPVVSDLVAQAWFVEEETDPSLRPDVVEWSQRTVDVEPDRAYWWARLAGRQLAMGNLDAVEPALDEALERQPWHTLSWTLMDLYARRTDDAELEALAVAKLCELGARSDCP